LAGTWVAFLVVFDSRIHFPPRKRIGLLPAFYCSAVKLAQTASFCRQRKRTFCPCLHSS